MLPPLVGYKTVVPQGAVISQSLTSLAGLAVNFDHQTQSFKKGAKDNPKKCLPKPQNNTCKSLGFQNHGFKTITKYTIQTLLFHLAGFEDVFGIVVKLVTKFFHIICANYGSKFKRMLSHEQLPKLLLRKETYNATIHIWLTCLDV